MGLETNIQLDFYVTSQGKKPFIEWLESLPKNVRYCVKTRLDRLALGNLGDCKYLREGVFELRFWISSGYRVYFAKEKDRIILILCGGNKSSQKKDIELAVKYWKNYLEE